MVSSHCLGVSSQKNSALFSFILNQSLETSAITPTNASLDDSHHSSLFKRGWFVPLFFAGCYHFVRFNVRQINFRFLRFCNWKSYKLTPVCFVVDMNIINVSFKDIQIVRQTRVYFTNG